MKVPPLHPLRVETVLRLLPEVDLLAPLRALVMASSRAHPGDSPFLTVGKRLAEPEHFAELVPDAVARFSAHLTSLCAFALEALDSQARGDVPQATSAFLRASRAEARVGREGAALDWLQHALRLAQSTVSRQSEIAVLRALGMHHFAAQQYEEAGRHFQRCLTLADAERDRDNAARACLALGAISIALGAPLGAASWHGRAAALVPDESVLMGHVRVGNSAVLALSGEVDRATYELERATALLRAPDLDDAHAAPPTRSPDDSDPLGTPTPLALAVARARAAARASDAGATLAFYRAALVIALTHERDPRLELIVRIELARCLIEFARLAEAEDVIRVAEEQAVVHGRPRELAQLYLLLGTIRGRQHDEAGFVFFEQAISLAGDIVPTPRLLAEAYLGYARFRRLMHDDEEAAIYVARARELYAELYDAVATTRLDAEWTVTAGAP